MTKFNKMYIISWFGENEHVSKRIQIHDRQLTWAFDNDLVPHVLAQNYEDSYYRDNVVYTKHNGKVLKALEARNILLKEFYNSDDDYALFADNDCYFYTGKKYGANDIFVKTMRNIPLENLRNIDMIIAIDPSTSPFSKDLEENKKKDETHWRFVPGYIASGLFILKNLKKHYNKELYFDTDFIKEDGSIIACEDQEFPIQLIHNNMGVFVCKNIIRKEEAASTSTWNNNVEQRRAKTKEGHDFISKKFDLPIQSESPSGSWMKKFKQINDKMRLKENRKVRLDDGDNEIFRSLFEEK